MRKKFMKVMLFAALTFSLGMSFVGCKDYDDDIKNLQGQLDGKVTPEQLQEKISTMQTALAEAKADATAAKADAAAAKEAAIKAKDDAAAAKAEVALVAAAAKEAAIKAAEAKVAEMKKEVEATLANKVDQDTFNLLVSRVAALETEVSAIIGHRLTSIAFVPETNINGIPAISFYSLSYVPQAFADHAENQSTTVDAGDAMVVGTKETTISYRLNPRMGVRVGDIGLPTFDCIVSTNEINTRAVDPSKAGVNTPIAPVAGQTMVIENGVLKLKVTKAITENINREWLTTGTTEKFYMASLNVPIAQAQWTAEEKASGIAPTVNSEYVRISESVVTPMLKQTGSMAVTGHDLNAVDANGKYIHYHDSTALYKSALDALVDHKVKWNATTDLKKMVEVCITDHASLADYKAYGLSFRFAIAKGAYLKGINNNTDQQQFAEIDNSTNGLFKSKTYSIGGIAQTAIGREPIVRAMLVDTVNNKLVAQRYIKLQFVKDITPAIVLPEYAFENSIVSCKDVVNRFGTQQMNELIYRQIDETPNSGTGMSKATFHKIYTGMEILSLTKDGAEILKTPLTWGTDANVDTDVEFTLVPDAQDNESFNLIWNMNEKAVGKIVPAKSAVYVIKVAHKDPTGLHGDVTKTYKTTIEIPAQSFKYLATYWQTGKIGEVFNVNPIVYNSTTNGDNGTLANRSHIEADLVNGFLYEATSLKPANLAQFIQYIRDCANVRFEFAGDKFKDYTHLAGYTTATSNTVMSKGNVEAATIANNFGATATENIKNLPWDHNETLGTGNNVATSTIKLSEVSATEATETAKPLVGKTVPVRLVVDYNTYNSASVKEFEVFFINPLTVDAKIGDKVQDAVINGSFVNVETGLTFTDWNGYAVAKSGFTNATEKQKYAVALWNYYGVKQVVFKTDGVTTNMAWNADKTALIPTDGVTNGPLPTGRSLGQYDENKAPVNANPVYLGYFNNNGTPVNLDYKMFIDVTVDYKWGSLTKQALQLDVLRAGGTPTRR